MNNTITPNTPSQNNPTPHHWAEVIHAWADGHAIQSRNISMDRHEWRTYEHEPNTEPYFSNAACEWRIKPQEKTGWIAINTIGNVTFSSVDKEHALYQHDLDNPVTECAIACIQITYTEGEGL